MQHLREPRRARAQHARMRRQTIGTFDQPIRRAIDEQRTPARIDDQNRMAQRIERRARDALLRGDDIEPHLNLHRAPQMRPQQIERLQISTVERPAVDGTRYAEHARHRIRTQKIHHRDAMHVLRTHPVLIELAAFEMRAERRIDTDEIHRAHMPVRLADPQISAHAAQRRRDALEHLRPHARAQSGIVDRTDEFSELARGNHRAGPA